MEFYTAVKTNEVGLHTFTWINFKKIKNGATLVPLTKEDLQMANKHIEGYAASLAFKEIQMKTMVKYHYTPLRMG